MEQSILDETEEWLEREEIMWRQRSREIWIQEGDRNTRFFHNRASKLKDRNRVDRLLNENGELTSDFNAVQGVVTGYFSKLFTTSQSSDIGVVIRCLRPCVEDRDNVFLL
ncbi:hypothetical protein SLE2022_211290 [Rubroshorea leprosula]